MADVVYLTAEYEGKKVQIDITDFDAFIFASNDDFVCVGECVGYNSWRFESTQYCVRKGDLKNFEIEEI